MPPTSRTADNALKDRPFSRHLAETGLVLAVSITSFLFFFGYLARPFKVEGMSMEPLFHEGDYVLVRRFHRERAARRGDIVVVEVPGGGYALKRVVAVGGDLVEFRAGAIFVNGENRGKIAFGDPGIELSVPSFTVDEGSVFLLGDNRAVSMDSRVWGALPCGRLYGKVVFGRPLVPPEERKDR